ncbi:MAG: hypothetical protein AAF193_09990 [Bacteroidota bacterium]
MNRIIPSGHYAGWVFHLAALVTILLFSAISYFKGKLWFIGIGTILLLVQIFLITTSGTYINKDWNLTLIKVFLISWTVALLGDIMLKMEDDKIQENPRFWIFSGLLLYSSVFFVLNLTFSSFGFKIPKSLIQTQFIIGNVFLQGGFLLAAIQWKRQTKK